jgi:hypothetical protein
MRRMILLVLAACEGQVPAVAGEYQRVVPGYASEEACASEHSGQENFWCVELLALCADGKAHVLVEDVLHHGRWRVSGAQVIMTMDQSPPGYTSDGTIVLEVGTDGSLDGASIYGQRAFTPATRDFGLCL